MRLFYLFITLFLLGFTNAEAKRVALVIGNDNYLAVTKLQKAVNDSKAVADTLRDIGFDVLHLTDLSNRDMNRAIFRDFLSKVQKNDEALFYYAGHGIEVRGRNYLLATDIPKVKPGNERFITTEAFAVDEIMAAIEEKGSRVSILMLDACRDNPFPIEGKRSLGNSRGLGRSEPPKGSFVMYSAGSRQAALDRLDENDPHPNSVYTRKLVPLLKSPGLSLTKMAKRLRGEVEALASLVNHDQYPAYYDQLKGEFFFIPGKIKTLSARPMNTNPDQVLWLSIEQSKKTSDFEFYLKQFPDGLYSAVAKLKLQQITALKVPAKLQIRKQIDYAVGKSFKDCTDCPEMIVVPPGSFLMGSPKSEKGHRKTEGPRHKVTIAKKFAVGKFEVTRDQFEIFINDTGHDAGNKCWTNKKSKWKISSGSFYYNPGFEQDGTHPVVCVNWNDANAFVSWLSRKTGKKYRLLSEAEWEYVARAGTDTPFWWGQSISPAKANYDGNYSYNGAKGKFRKKTVPVDEFKPNGFGLYNVHGNVWEWVEDCWHKNYRGAPKDGTAWTKDGECSKRVLRSGSWFFYPNIIRSSIRNTFHTDFRYADMGFRVSRTLSH